MTTTTTSTSYIIDCHTHMYDSKLIHDIEAIIESSEKQGVKKIIVVGENEQSNEQVLTLCTTYPHIFKVALGLHPCHVHSRDQIQSIIHQIRSNVNSCVCIGEVGLDFTPSVLKQIATQHNLTVDQVKQLQREALSEMCKLSVEYNLPLNVHSRSAGRPTIQLLQQCGVKLAMLHAFDGSIKVAKQGVQSGYYFSIPANICRSDHFQNLAQGLPIEHLLIETDSPALLPQLPDHTSEEELVNKLLTARNEPKNAVLSCQMIAKLRSMELEQVIETMMDNTRTLFPRVFL